jgi:hypothetical protein
MIAPPNSAREATARRLALSGSLTSGERLAAPQTSHASNLSSRHPVDARPSDGFAVEATVRQTSVKVADKLVGQ